MTNDAREPRDQRDPGVSSSGAADIGRSAPEDSGVSTRGHSAPADSGASDGDHCGPGASGVADIGQLVASESDAPEQGASAPVDREMVSQSEVGEPPRKSASAKRPPTGSVVKWRPSVLGVATGSLAAFLSALALLAWQLGSGNDPALGAGNAEIEQPRDRVKRKVIVTRVVHDPPKAPRVTAPAGAPTAAPAAVAPPPPVAPAPPPPPPPVTQSS